MIAVVEVATVGNVVRYEADLLDDRGELVERHIGRPLLTPMREELERAACLQSHLGDGPLYLHIDCG